MRSVAGKTSSSQTRESLEAVVRIRFDLEDSGGPSKDFMQESNLILHIPSNFGLYAGYFGYCLMSPWNLFKSYGEC